MTWKYLIQLYEYVPKIGDMNGLCLEVPKWFLTKTEELPETWSSEETEENAC